MGKIEGDAAVGVEGILFYAADNTDDGHPRIGRVANALADRILAGPEFTGHKFGDQDHRGLVEGVKSGVEEAAPRERDLHGFKIVTRCDAFVGVDEILAGRRNATFDVDGTPRPEFAERQRGDAASGGDGWDLFETVPELAIGVEGDFFGSVILAAKRKTESEDIVGIEARGDILQANEASEHEGECQFRDDDE